MSKNIGVLGGGLVGSMISILLAKKGYRVEVFEKRPDPRVNIYSGGRSINLALSHRGIRTLKMGGIFDRIEPLLIPMYGRQVHTHEGETFQPYGKSHQYINSVSRQQLNNELIEEAIRTGALFRFNQTISSIDPKTAHITAQSGERHEFDFILGADGAFSSLRKVMGELDPSIETVEDTLSHSYKELRIPSKNEKHAITPNALHIWPRKKYMLIALPNTDHSFTCTLFLQDHGNPSFDQLDTPDEIRSFLTNSFPDAVSYMDNVVEQFQENPQSSLQTIKTYPWKFHKSLLIGDSAHAIVPFYGQGMNAGFEDCRILVELLDLHQHDWEIATHKFQLERKKDADAIAELALRNFREMSADVIDDDFLKRKELEKRLSEQFPEDWLPLYTMVTFSDIPYHEALRLGDLQYQVISKLGKNYDPKAIDLKGILIDFMKSKKAPH